MNPCSELEPGQDRQAREEHESPVSFALLDPGVQRDGPFKAMKPADYVGEYLERWSEPGARERIGVRLDRGLDWDEIAGIAEDAYAEVAPPKLVEAARRGG